MNIGDRHISLFGIVLTIMSILIPTYVAYDIYAKQAKESGVILIEEVSRHSMSSSSLASGKNIQYYIDGKRYNNLISSVFYITNSGNKPIEPDDFYKPITLSTGHDLEVVDLSVTATIPRDLDADWAKNNDQSYSMKPALLNPGDLIAVNILLKPMEGVEFSDYIDKDIVEWTARIKNVLKLSIKNVYEGVLLRSYVVPDAFTFKDLLEGTGFIIELNYKSLPLFLVLIFTFSFLGFLLISPNISRKEKLLIIINVFLSISTSEIIVFYIFGSTFARSGDYIINLPLVVIHLLFFIYLYYAYRKHALTKP